MKICLSMAVAVCVLAGIATESGAESAAERDARMQWWREARFGMFVHWGLYSSAAGEWDGKKFGGGVEWIQCYAGVPADEYAKRQVPLFKPKEGFAKEWARTAREAGCKYVVFTSKHHEGFALHDSAVSDFDAKDACGRDIFKEIVEALRAEGLRVGVYHSVIDWHHPQAYVGMGLPSIKGTVNEGRDNNVYLDYLHAQVKEIVSNYGPIDVLWWDFSSPQIQGDKWRSPELVERVRKAQPAVIMNNRLYHSPNVGGDNLGIFDITKGDFTTPEQHIPARGLPGVDWETCMTMNGTWGYSAHDLNWKSTQALLRNLVDIASKGGNYLLNVGPMADGTIPDASVERMREIGAWLKVNGESVYGTTSTPFTRLPWRCTKKNGLLYVHVFDAPADRKLTLRGLKNKVKGARLLADPDRKPLAVSNDGGTHVIALPESLPASPVTVVAVEVEGIPEADDSKIVANADGSILLQAVDAVIKGGTMKLEGDNLGYWLDDKDSAEWTFEIQKPGRFRVEADVAVAPSSAGAVCSIGVLDQAVGGPLESTGGWQNYVTVKPGRLILEEAGRHILFVKGRKAPNGEAVMNLRAVRLLPEL